MDEIPVTVYRTKNFKNRIYDSNMTIINGNLMSEEEKIVEEEIAKQILQRYFLQARQYKQINANALTNIKKLA